MQRYTMHKNGSGLAEEGVLVGEGPFTPETYRYVDRLAAAKGGFVIWHDFLGGGTQAPKE